MNKVFVFGLIIAALVAVSFAEDLPCDKQMGVRICTNRNGECINNIVHDPEETSEEYERKKCKCYVELGDCLDRVECNGTTMWNAMVLCTNAKCDGCQFFASASTVFPTLALVALIALLALFSFTFFILALAVLALWGYIFFWRSEPYTFLGITLSRTQVTIGLSILTAFVSYLALGNKLFVIAIIDIIFCLLHTLFRVSQEETIDFSRPA